MNGANDSIKMRIWKVPFDNDHRTSLRQRHSRAMEKRNFLNNTIIVIEHNIKISYYIPARIL